MTITVDQQPCSPELDASATLGDAMAWLQSYLARSGKVVVKVEMDGQPLDGPALTSARTWPIDQRCVSFFTADQRQLARAMVGKIAALIEFLNPQHAEIAGLIESNQTPKALEKLSGVLSAWQQIYEAYRSTATMLAVDVATFRVGEVMAGDLLADFAAMLSSVQESLQNHDMVMLADILQYEMDGVVANWVALLEATSEFVEARS